MGNWESVLNKSVLFVFGVEMINMGLLNFGNWKFFLSSFRVIFFFKVLVKFLEFCNFGGRWCYIFFGVKGVLKNFNICEFLGKLFWELFIIL